MSYKKLVKDYKKGEMMIGELIVSSEWEENELLGVSLKDFDKPKAIIKNKSGSAPDFLIGGTSLPVISDKVKSILESLPRASELEFLPLEMKNYNKKQSYWVLNILIILEGLDYEKSDLLLHESSNTIRSINKMVLREDVIDDRLIFYLDESPVEIFVSEKLIEIFEKEGVTGYTVEALNG